MCPVRSPPTTPAPMPWQRCWADAGFRSVQLFGAFADEERSHRQRLVLRLRRFVLDHTPLSRLLAQRPRLASLLQRASYGAMRPLPAAVEAEEARRCFARVPLVPSRHTSQHASIGCSTPSPRCDAPRLAEIYHESPIRETFCLTNAPRPSRIRAQRNVSCRQ